MLLSSGSSSDTVNTSVDESIRIRALRFLDAMLRQHRARLCIGVWLALERDTEFGGYDDDAEEMGSLEHDKHPSGYWALLKHWNDAVKVTENNMNASSYGKSEMARRACTFLIGVLEKDMVECYGRGNHRVAECSSGKKKRPSRPSLLQAIGKHLSSFNSCKTTRIAGRTRFVEPSAHF